jgi:hypothetical protein
VCPICMGSTWSKWLTHVNKCCYMGPQRLLHMDHRWRMNKRAFDGTQELDGPPVMSNSEDILRQLDILFECGDHDACREKRQKTA